VTLVVLAACTGLTACGSDQESTYADGWDSVCRGVGGALSTFRTDASTAATSSPDAGDAEVLAGTRAAAVSADLIAPAKALQAALERQFDSARRLDPPKDWASWHATELRTLAARRSAVADGVRRLQGGDPDALPLLAVGSVGPADVDAPEDLRNKTPDCTVMR
jgi:hypothetical protein